MWVNQVHQFPYSQVKLVWVYIYMHKQNSTEKPQLHHACCEYGICLQLKRSSQAETMLSIQ